MLRTVLASAGSRGLSVALVLGSVLAGQAQDFPSYTPAAAPAAGYGNYSSPYGVPLPPSYGGPAAAPMAPSAPPGAIPWAPIGRNPGMMPPGPGMMPPAMGPGMGPMRPGMGPMSPGMMPPGPGMGPMGPMTSQSNYQPVFEGGVPAVNNGGDADRGDSLLVDPYSSMMQQGVIEQQQFGMWDPTAQLGPNHGQPGVPASNLFPRWSIGGEYFSWYRSKPMKQTLARSYTQALGREDAAFATVDVISPGAIHSIRGSTGTATPATLALPTALDSDQFEYGGFRSGWRTWIGAEISPDDRIKFKYERLNGANPNTISLVDGNLFDDNRIRGEYLLTQANSEILNPNFISTQELLVAPFATFLATSDMTAVIMARYVEMPAWGLDLVWEHDLDDFLADFRPADDWQFTLLLGLRTWYQRDTFNYFNDFNNSTATLTNSVFEGDVTGISETDEAFRVFVGHRNFLVGPQIGMALKKELGMILDLDLMAKGGIALNFQESQLQAVRMDGVGLLFDSSRGVSTDQMITKKEVSTAGIMEGRFALTLHPVQSVNLRAGYEFMSLIGVGNAIEQINPLLTQANRPGRRDSIFYHGWFAGMEVSY